MQDAAGTKTPVYDSREKRTSYQTGEAYFFAEPNKAVNEFVKYCNGNGGVAFTYRPEILKERGFEGKIVGLTQQTYDAFQFMSKIRDCIADEIPVLIDGLEAILRFEGPGSEKNIVKNFDQLKDDLMSTGYKGRKSPILFVTGDLSKYSQNPETNRALLYIQNHICRPA